MAKYLVLVDVESPEPLLVKVSAASFNDAEFLAMRALDIPYKSAILGVWDLDDVEAVRNLLPPRIDSAAAKDKPVSVRRHVRRA